MSEARGRRRAAAAAVALAACASLAAREPGAPELLRLADRARRDYAEAILSVRVTNYEGDRVTSSADFDLYRKGDDRSLIVFTGGSQKGRKILTVGSNFWLIVPGSSHAIPVTASQRLVGGASMGDVARLSFADDFDGKIEPGIEEVGGLPCDVLALTARDPHVPYGSARLWLDRRDHLPRQAVLRLPSGKEAKIVEFGPYRREGGRVALTRMVIRDLLVPQRQERTVLEYSRYRLARLPDSLFTPEGARGL